VKKIREASLEELTAVVGPHKAALIQSLKNEKGEQ
jgi:hypothetical protein